MTFPSSDVTTSDMDSTTDSPSAARAAIHDLATKFNLLRNHVGTYMQGLLTAATRAAALIDLLTDVTGGAAGKVLTWTGAASPPVWDDAYKDVLPVVPTGIYGITSVDRGKSVDTIYGVTIPSNASNALPVGFVFSITNTSSAAIVVSCTDSLRLGGTTTVGTSRTIGAYGQATVRKVSATVWWVAGAGVS